jgi:hypothetical protein
MRVLYHFARSPFSRRVRLALAHKGLTAELREARANPAFLEEARALSPLRTMPVLLEEDGHAIGDSRRFPITSIAFIRRRRYGLLRLTAPPSSSRRRASWTAR